MRKNYIGGLVLATLLVPGFISCKDDAPAKKTSATSGSTSGTSSGTTAGVTSGSTSGTTSGVTSGTTSATTSASTSASTSATTNQGGEGNGLFGEYTVTPGDHFTFPASYYTNLKVRCHFQYGRLNIEAKHQESSFETKLSFPSSLSPGSYAVTSGSEPGNVPVIFIIYNASEANGLTCFSSGGGHIVLSDSADYRKVKLVEIPVRSSGGSSSTTVSGLLTYKRL